MPFIRRPVGRKFDTLPGVQELYKSTNVFVNNVPVALWDIPNGTGGSFDGVDIPSNPYTVEYASNVINEVGSFAPHDDPDSNVVNYGIPDNTSSIVEGATTDNTTATKLTPIVSPTVCGSFATDPIDYNQQLTTNYTIGSLSTRAFFKHNIVAQHGLTVADIICNLKAVAEIQLEPIRKKYPGFQINSGFRKGDSTSQHERGQAVDMQWLGQSAADSLLIAYWIRDNLPFDQMIYEHGNNRGVWIHVSFDRNKKKQKGQLLTMLSGAYTSGLTNFYG
jgi:hypothetical protein